MQALRHSSLNEPLRLFLTTRVLLSLWAFTIITFLLMPAVMVAARGGALVYQSLDSGLGYYLLEPWNRYDAQWYIKIAAEGYGANDGSTAFFPLYPMLIRIVGTLIGGQWLAAAFIVSNIALFGAMIVLHRLVAEQFDPITARRTLIAWLIFPTAFFLFAGYSEALFVLLASLTMRAVQQRNWQCASVFAGLATLTRAPGILLVAVIALAWWMQRRQNQARWLDVLPALIPILCGAAYWLYLGWQFGDASIWSRGVAYWRVNTLPGQSLVATLQMIAAGSDRIGNHLIDVTFTLFFIGMIIVGLKKLPPLWSLYSIVTLLPPLLSMQTVIRDLPLASLPRYGIVVFPIFVTLALVRLPPIVRLIGATFALILQMLFIGLFVNWIWIA
jgi:Gpi18-like mannosyltransferase